MNLLPPSKDARAKWIALLRKELQHCMDIGIDLDGHGTLLRTMRAHKGTWEWSIDTMYAYRTILPNEIVFDLGDDIKRLDESGQEVRTEQSWGDIVDQSEALWDELDAMISPGGHYYACLSGGKGVHTHIFLEDPTDGEMWDGTDFNKHDLRSKIAEWVDARRRVKGVSAIHYDPVCISPSHGSRQLREFGSVKTRTKTLFFVGPLGRRPLPRDQGQAYLLAGIKYPAGIVRCRSVSGLTHAQFRVALGTKCPRSAACVITNDVCDECPI